jgi:hypothetical protein
MDIALPAIDAFVDELIAKKFSGKTLDDAVLADIKRELTERLNQYLTLRTIEMISTANPEAVKELAELIKTNPKPEEVGTFINTHVSEPDVLVAQIFTDFRQLYLGVEEKKTN